MQFILIGIPLVQWHGAVNHKAYIILEYSVYVLVEENDNQGAQNYRKHPPRAVRRNS